MECAREHINLFCDSHSGLCFFWIYKMWKLKIYSYDDVLNPFNAIVLAFLMLKALIYNVEKRLKENKAFKKIVP